jgi:hypothetical protein
VDGEWPATVLPPVECERLAMPGRLPRADRLRRAFADDVLQCDRYWPAPPGLTVATEERP